MPPKVSPIKSKKNGARRRKVKAKKVLRFTIEELNEERDVFLTTYNPYMSENCVEFDRKTRSFKPILDYRKPVIVYQRKGVLKRKLPEAVEILYAEAGKEEEVVEERMRNKFNFRSVASQTTYTHPADHGNQMDATLFPVLKFKGTASKSQILAAYQVHEKVEGEKDKYVWIPSALEKISKYIGRKTVPFQDSNRRYLRLCERMVDQNLSEANLDYNFYDNVNDEFRLNFGSLLPLWRFTCGPTKRLPVTDIAWSGHFSDLFAVGFRTFNEAEEDEDDLGLMREVGCVCVYSLKGPAHPEKIVNCSFAVRCLSFHPKWPHLLATGCEGGIVSVYDLRREENNPAGTNKMTEKILHRDTVSALKWLPDVLPQKFCTVSTDGKVLNWQFLLNDLFLSDDVTSLKVSDWSGEVPPKGIEMDSQESGLTAPEVMGMNMAVTSMSVNHHARDLFAVGTETGVIYECSFDSKSQVRSYEDHKHSVGSVHWNPYHKKVFLSNSDDMTVRIWDETSRECVFEFFFENEVKDACWAPFSSTLFAAISGNAVVHVFDLAVSKEAIGKYTVYTAKEGVSLTTLCFHPKKPILMVGDEKGHVIAFKLSPNLRSSLKALETLEESAYVAAEIEKMNKLLAPSKGRINGE